jgi:murein DD-endopeptidase MepM/ murein hydrolase activator NlpD
MHPIHNRPLPHPGVDISAPRGTSIYAAAKGRVIRAGWVVGYGLTIEIDHGFGYMTLYGHHAKLLWFSERFSQLESKIHALY